MTTNHPAHGPVSLDRLHQIREILSKASAQSDGGNLGYAMADAVKVIDVAIASFGDDQVTIIKPVSDLYGITSPTGSETTFTFDAGEASSFAKDGWTVQEYVELERYQQAMAGNYPVVQLPTEFYSENGVVVQLEKVMAALALNGVEYKRNLQAPRVSLRDAISAIKSSGIEVDAREIQAERDALNSPDCRLPFDQWLSQQNEPIDVDCGCVTTEAFYHWLRVAYEAGNSPVTPDGWQLVPKEPTEAMNKAGWEAMNEHDAINPTYRAMLAAAPQQEVKSALEHGMQRYSGAMQKLSERDK